MLMKNKEIPIQVMDVTCFIANSPDRNINTKLTEPPGVTHIPL
jgi:hypothetical protein